MKTYDYLIVGAGLFGAVFAQEAKKAGKKCLVIDKRSHIAGNIMAITSILNSNDAEMLEKLRTENILLMEENKKLSETVDWMHDTIWRLVHIQRSEN